MTTLATNSDFNVWSELAPEAAARRLLEAAKRLAPDQLKAVFARLFTLEELLHRFSGARRSQPLAGVPYVIKDVFPIAGELMTAGSAFLADLQPPAVRDGALVQDMESLGAVLAGRSQLHEFAYGITGENRNYGDVVHPRHPGRTSGGSSSGSAAAVAAGVVPLAFGTDTAGSIRVPASFCGIYGFRMAPHHAWISDAFPLAPSFDTAGWFTAKPADMLTCLNAFTGKPAPGPSVSGAAWLSLPGVEPSLAEAQERAAESLGFCPLARDLAEPLLKACAEAPAAFNALRAPEAWRVHKSYVTHHADKYDPVVLARIRAGEQVTRSQWIEAVAARDRLIAAFDAVWVEHEALSLPATPLPALTKAQCTQASRDSIFALTTPASLAGLSALTLPVSLPDGLSTGLQVLAPSTASPVFRRILEQPIAQLT